MISEEAIRRTMKKLKKKKSCNNEGWTNEMIIEGSEKMVKILMLKEVKILDEWPNTKIKGDKKEMNNKGGSFQQV